MEDKKIGTIEGHEIKTGTPPGAAYVNKVTHPPSPMTSEYQGRPDCSQSNVVLLELKSEVNVPPIITIPTGITTTVTQNPSSLLFLQASGGVCSNYVFQQVSNFPNPTLSNGWVQPQNQGSSSTQPAISQVSPPSTLNSGYNFNNWNTDVASFRMTYKSTTYYLNATSFNNQGTVTTAKFKPNIIRAVGSLQFLQLHSESQESTNSARRALRAALNHHNESRPSGEKIRMTDGYEVIDPVTNATDAFNFQIIDFGRNSGAILNATSTNQLYINNCMPLTASALMTFSPKAATRPARDGAFVVQQQVGPVLDWQATQETINAQATIPSGLCLSFYRVWNGTSYQVAPLYSTQSTANSPSTGEVQWGDLDWSYTLFEGLTVPTTVGISLTSVPYITLKSITGYELQVQPNSSLASFQRSLPLPDPDAINMAIGIMHARPDSLPSSANDLASIATTALKFLPTAVTWLKDLFGTPKTKEKAMVKARNFVAPKQKKEKTLQKQTPMKSNNKMQKQLKDLTNKVAEMSVDRSPASTLPSYTTNGSGKSKSTERPSRSRTVVVRRRN